MKEVVAAIPDFNKLIDKEHTSIPNRSVALFTLSALHHGTKALLKEHNGTTEIHMPEWKDVASKRVKSSEIRRDSLSPLSITLRSLGQIGNELINKYPDRWDERLSVIEEIDWKKTNPLWQNGIVVNGIVQLSHATQAQMIEILRKIVL